MTKHYLRNLLCLCSAIALLLVPRQGNAVDDSVEDAFNARNFLAANHIQSLEEYTQWIENNLRYKSDLDVDRWQSPEETVHRKTGDCEDLAFLHAEILKTFGFQPAVIAHGRGKEAHVYTVFKRGDFYYTLENTHLANTQMKTLKDMAAFLAQKENAEYLLELSFESKSFKTLYRMARIHT